jgi:DNA-directed RNA polymerase subunit RPC12/RpoP
LLNIAYFNYVNNRRKRYALEVYVMKERDYRKEKIEADKRLLKAEIVTGLFGIGFLLTMTGIAAYAPVEEWLKTTLIIVGVAPIVAVCPFLLKLEQTAGEYECAKCKTKYVPEYKSVFWAPHIGFTRYMKCPHCNKKSWHKKKIEE